MLHPTDVLPQHHKHTIITKKISNRKLTDWRRRGKMNINAVGNRNETVN